MGYNERVNNRKENFMTKKPNAFWALKSIVVLLAITIISLSVPVSFAVTFNDVSGHWAEKTITNVSEYGVISGYPDGSFKPDSTIKRIEYLVLVIKAQSIEVRERVGTEYWGKPFVEAAIEANYIKADEFGSTDLSVYEKPILRQEMASIITKAYLATGATVTGEAIAEASQKLTDYNTVSNRYLDSVITAVAIGIINGYPDSTFKPMLNATRAESSVVLEKYLATLNKIELVTDNLDASGYAAGHAFATLSTPFSVNDIEIGDSSVTVKEIYGEPVRIDDSAYGFKWWVYHDNYEDYFLVGVSNQKVVALFTASDLLKSSTSLAMNQNKSAVTKALGNPINSIFKGADEYIQMNNQESAVYLKNNIYLTTYFDNHDSGRLFSIMLIDTAVEKSMTTQYGNLTDAVRISFEKQIFDLNNVFRLENGKPILRWSEPIANVARKHSKDMAVRDFFDHINPSGQSPFDRIAAYPIDFKLAAENIAAGYLNAFGAHAGWVNSFGHRENLVRNIQFLGVGVYFGGPFGTYYTQNYFTPL
jgi:uncharacterized protein YkwD